MESTIYDQLSSMDTTGSPTQFIPPAMPLDVFTPITDPVMLPPVPYAPLLDYPMMDQATEIDLLSRVPPQMQPPPAGIHGAGASYNLNNTSSLAVALDPVNAVPTTRSRANTLTSQLPTPPFVPAAPVVPFVSGLVPVEQAPIPPLLKQEDLPKERVVGSMLKTLAQVIKSAGDACQQHQATRPITPGDEQKTRQVIAQMNDFIQGMGLPTTATTAHADNNCRKRHAGDMKEGEQPPVKKIPKPEPEDVNLSIIAPNFVRTHTASRSQPPSRPHTPPLPLTIKPTFRAGFPPFNLPNPPMEHPPRFGQAYRHHHSRSMGSIPRDVHHVFSPVSAPVGRMGRGGYFQPEHGWASKAVTPTSAPTLSTFTYPGTIEPITPISAIPSTATEVVDEEDEEDADLDDTQSPSGSHHSYSESLSSGSEIPQEYRAEVDRVFLEYLNRICSNLDAADNKGDPIHQQLMPKKMQKLDESTDFRPFKFRIQAFTAAFLEELAAQGYPEEKIPMKKVRNYLWRQPLILRFNEDGKKAKSKGNHIWNVEAKRLVDGTWEFRPFHRKIAGTPAPVAYCGLLWQWQPRISDPQACWQNIPVSYSSPNLPSWLTWKGDVLSGSPPPNAESCEVTTHAKFTLEGQEGMLTRTFFLNIAPRISAENPFGPTFAAVQRTSHTPRRSVSDTIVPARSIPRTPALVTDEDEARVKLVLEGVAQRLTQETQPLGNSPELNRQKHVVHVAVNACQDDSDHPENAPQGSHELAVAGADVVAHAAEYIVRKTAPPGTVVLPTNSSAIQNVNTEDLVETTRGAIAQAVKESRWTSEIDELAILLIACRVLDKATPSAHIHWSPSAHMPPPSTDWYASATYV